MPGLFTSLLSAADSLQVFQRALDVAQQNVSNASTPNFARQEIFLKAKPFDVDGGLVGGVSVGAVRTARDQYADAAVQRQLSAWGFYDSKSTHLGRIESAFDVTGQTGISAALEKLYQSFSAWSLTPNSHFARQTVLDNAQQLGTAFQETAARLRESVTDVDRQLRTTVGSINEIAARIGDYNQKLRHQFADDSGVQASLSADLDELSKLMNFTTLTQSDGSLEVLLAGQTALVVGDNVYPIRVESYTPADPPPVNASAPPSVRILAADGRDITAQASQGSLGGLLEVRNRVLPSSLGDAWQPGGLNQLAQAIADRVNAILSAGQIAAGPPEQAGIPLFQYDAAHPTAAAETLTVNPSITPDQLAAIDPGPPPVSNGIALRLSALENSAAPADQIQGYTYTAFYAAMAAGAGQQSKNAADDAGLHEQLVTQSRNQRQQISGVSLDEEAMFLMQFQKAYEATSRMISVLNTLTEETINLLR